MTHTPTSDPSVASIAPCALFSASTPGIRARLRRFAELQIYFLCVAAMIYGILWAIQPESTHLSVVIVYTLCLSNFTALGLGGLSFLYAGRTPLMFWLWFALVLVVLTSVTVPATSAIVFYAMSRPGGPFWSYLGYNWKFASVATLAFGIGAQAYQAMKFRLERRNLELQQTVESNVAERELQEQELKHARELQQALFPKEIPQIEGFQIAGTWEPARMVGGDYFDVIPMSEKKVGICIADVVGRSVPAALLMANVQATVRAFAQESASPASLVERVNSALCANAPPEKFVTLLYGVLDAEEKLFRYTSAGHPRPILRRASGSVEQLGNGGAVLGVFPTWQYKDSVVTLAPGDMLVLFTDGITEAAKPEGDEFGEERLIHLVGVLGGQPPARLNEKLLEDVKAFCGAPLEDDVTLITIAAGAAKPSVDYAEKSPSLAVSAP